MPAGALTRGGRAPGEHIRPRSAVQRELDDAVRDRPGAGTATNRPELFAHARADNGETAAEQAQENRLSAQLLSVPAGYSTLALPDVGNLRLLKRTVRLRQDSA